ncbi:MAG: hypothetical protein ACFFCZ_31365 [Promethearchaeota archaeon]
MSRHLSRLIDQGFVTKQPLSREFELAPLGELAVRLFSPLDFVFRHGEYFRSHRLSELPTSLVWDLDILNESEIISGAGYVMSKLPEIINACENELWVMTDQPFP